MFRQVIQRLGHLLQIKHLFPLSIANVFARLELGLVPQPLAVALSVGLGIFHDGQTVFHTDGVAEPPDGAGAVPEVSECPAAAQTYSAPNDMIVDVGFVDMGSDDKGIVPLAKAPGKLHRPGDWPPPG